MTEVKPPEKLVVLIPTRDRPNYLHLTVRSVLEQARQFGHKNVQVVVSDPVSMRENAEKNARLLGRLQQQFPETPVHYYGPGQPEPIRKLLADATRAEKKAFGELVPKDGHYGAHRNRLTLLAVYHGGRDAAYLHLDDDTPIALINKEKGILRKHPKDALDLFLQGYREAVAAGAPGFYGDVEGVKDSLTSSAEPSDLKSQLKRAEFVRVTCGGPGRVLSARALMVPYIPYGINEDFEHTWRLQAELEAEMYEKSEFSPLLAHIGVTGPRLLPSREHPSPYATLYHSSLPLKKHWPSLVNKMLKLSEAK
ncbi:MAG: glycosyltransferase family A protein [Candidatus Micrarchaeota archaeon]